MSHSLDTNILYSIRSHLSQCLFNDMAIKSPSINATYPSPVPLTPILPMSTHPKTCPLYAHSGLLEGHLLTLLLPSSYQPLTATTVVGMCSHVRTLLSSNTFSTHSSESIIYSPLAHKLLLIHILYLSFFPLIHLNSSSFHFVSYRHPTFTLLLKVFTISPFILCRMLAFQLATLAPTFSLSHILSCCMSDVHQQVCYCVLSDLLHLCIV